MPSVVICFPSYFEIWLKDIDTGCVSVDIKNKIVMPIVVRIIDRYFNFILFLFLC